MPQEPPIKRVTAFIDGQNLFHAAKAAFGYTFPNYDPLVLARTVCGAHAGWQVGQVRFYTGVPDIRDNPVWHRFWSAKLLAMSRQGVKTFQRPLKYRNRSIEVPGGPPIQSLVGEEKGIDVRIALDAVGEAFHRRCDVVLIFSQDQDLSEVAEEIRAIAQFQGRWIKIASAYPNSPALRNVRGINNTDWIRIDRRTYDLCIDRFDYR